MASIKFGNVVVDMRGKISGNVYAKNKGGAYSRVRVVPTNPRTIYQSTVRAILTVLSQAWRGLTAVQRESWNSAVGNFARTNRIGDKHNLSGNALYVSLNKNLADVGIAAIDTAPLPEAVETVDVLTAVADNSSQSVIITLGAAVPVNTSLKIFATSGLSPGISTPGTRLRQISSAQAGDAAALTLTADYLAKFGAVPAAGSKIFYSLVPVNETTGQLGAEVRGVMVVQA